MNIKNSHLFNDISGQRFGKLIAIQPIDKSKSGNIIWLCICNCESKEYTQVRASNLLNGTIQSCGCLQQETTRQKAQEKHKNLIGTIINGITILEIKEVDPVTEGYFAKARCGHCNRIWKTLLTSIITGHAKSCGCLKAKRSYDRALAHKGEKNNRLEIIDVLDRKYGKALYYLGVCDCGELDEFQYAPFKNGTKKSCGCLLHEWGIENGGKNHSRYNPDRDYIKAAKIYRSFFGKKYYLARKYVGSKVLEKYFGYSLKEFKAHVEAQFTNGMTWQNYSILWEIDHIFPIAEFIRNGVTNHKIIHALINLRPILKSENRKKQAKITEESLKVLHQLNLPTLWRRIAKNSQHSTFLKIMEELELTCV